MFFSTKMPVFFGVLPAKKDRNYQTWRVRIGPGAPSGGSPQIPQRCHPKPRPMSCWRVSWDKDEKTGNVGVSENVVYPFFTQINPMVLLIIIQFLNGYLFGNIAYFQTNPHDWCNWKWDKENLVMSVSIQSSCLKNKGTWHTTPFPMTAIPKITPNCRTLRWKINSISTETWPKGSDPAPAFSIWEGLRGWLFRFESQSSENPKADWWF